MLSRRILRAYDVFERFIVLVVLALLMVVVLWGTATFAIEVVTKVVDRLRGAPPDPASTLAFLHEFSLLREIFGAFLLLLIGVELMKTVVTYFDRHELHVEVVFTVAMIALARHAIDLDLNKIAPLTLVGMAATIAALAVGYYLFRKANDGRGAG
jgi:uncharacterized membrane protein (DUF373 family)